MPAEGVFARVVRGGRVADGEDPATVVLDGRIHVIGGIGAIGAGALAYVAAARPVADLVALVNAGDVVPTIAETYPLERILAAR